MPVMNPFDEAEATFSSGDESSNASGKKRKTLQQRHSTPVKLKKQLPKKIHQPQTDLKFAPRKDGEHHENRGNDFYWKGLECRGFGFSNNDTSCLLNTVHVKTASALITMAYLLSLACVDQWITSEIAPSAAYNTFCALSGALLATILLAQYGIRKEYASFLIPLIVAQVLAGLGIAVCCMTIISSEVQILSSGSSCFARFLMVTGSAVCLFGLHLYCTLIVHRCWKYMVMQEKERTLERFLLHSEDDDNDEDDVVHFDKGNSRRKK